jgi:hypothetical protein
MLSRQDLRDFTREYFALGIIPILDQTDVMTGITEVLSEDFVFTLAIAVKVLCLLSRR